MKLLSAEMPVIWKPMTQSIWYTWNNLLVKANVLINLKQESWPKLSPCLLKYTAKQGHSDKALRNSSQFFLWQIIVKLIWNGNSLRLSSKSTIFKRKIHLNLNCRPP